MHDERKNPNERKPTVPESQLRRVHPHFKAGEKAEVPKGFDFLGDILPLLGKFPSEEVGKLFLDLLRMFFTGGNPCLHAIIDIKEKKLSICVYDGETKGRSTTLIDM